MPLLKGNLRLLSRSMASVCHALGRGAARCRAGAHAAGAAACAGPGRAVAGGVRWGGSSVCASGVGSLPCRGPALQGFGRWASGCALLLCVRRAGGAEPLCVRGVVGAFDHRRGGACGCWRGCRGG